MGFSCSKNIGDILIASPTNILGSIESKMLKVGISQIFVERAILHPEHTHKKLIGNQTSKRGIYTQ